MGWVSFAVAIAATSPAFAGHLHPDLAADASGPEASSTLETVIVVSAPGHISTVKSEVQQRGANNTTAYPMVGAVSATMPASALVSLSQDPGVAAVEPDEPVRASLDQVTLAVGANRVWSNPGLTGSGVTVAVLDSGIYRHPDLAGRIRGWVDLVNGRPAPYDDFGHGTHVAGIIAGNGRMSSHPFDTRPQVGMAPQASLVGVKVLDDQGHGHVSTVIAGIEWCIEHRSQYGIRVINLSLGHRPMESYLYDPLCQACEAAERAGVLVVVAAGNAGSLGFQTIDSPANDPAVLTAGSFNIGSVTDISRDRVSSYSGRGPTLFDHVVKPDLLAPGNQIISLLSPGSTLATNYPQLVVSPSLYSTHTDGPAEYMTLSGTSMAAAVASGAAALLLQQDPSQGPGMVKARLMVGASHVARNLRGVLYTGAGFLNVAHAVQIPEPTDDAASTAMAMSPLLSRLDNGLIGVMNGSGPLWSPNLIWGSNAFWGDDTAALSAYWAGDTGASDASSSDQASNAFWGDGAIVYGNPLIWGDNPKASSSGNITASNAFWGYDAVWSSSTTARNAFWGSDPSPSVAANTAGPALSSSNAFWGGDLVYGGSSTAGWTSGTYASNAFWGDDAPPG